MRIEELHGEAIDAERSALAGLVRDSVENGASVGFVLPFADGELDRYVDMLAATVDTGTRHLWCAHDEDGTVVGMVQLDLATRSNSRHRAEVQKLLVHSRARRRGIGTLLMDVLEVHALTIGRTLLVLDTESGSGAEPLYRGRGFTEVGQIPRYAGLPDGSLIATTVFYKHLA
jgi:ribosomal protein S18 acetylase RimI-like enzyme